MDLRDLKIENRRIQRIRLRVTVGFESETSREMIGSPGRCDKIASRPEIGDGVTACEENCRGRTYKDVTNVTRWVGDCVSNRLERFVA